MDNNYGALIDNFIAPDLFNAVMPSVPPADLSIPGSPNMASSFLSYRVSAASRVVGFNSNDVPYFLSLGMGSNIADGLVDSNSIHEGVSAGGWKLQFQPKRLAPTLTGTFTSVNYATGAVVGNATKFLSECFEGLTLNWIDGNGVAREGIVQTITDDLNLTLISPLLSTNMYAAATPGGTLVTPYSGNGGDCGGSITLDFLRLNEQFAFNNFIFNTDLLKVPLGTITMVTGSATVNGVGTRFLSDFSSGSMFQAFDDAGVKRTYVISAIASDIQMTLTHVARSNVTAKPFLDADDTLRVKVIPIIGFQAYTVSVDPAYGIRRMSIWAEATVAHTYALIGVA